MVESVVDLEEGVGSYLNCLSTSCAAGSRLYASLGKIVDDKFHEIFPDADADEDTGCRQLKTCFQSLQTQNAFEGYQRALLDCKEKLLEILIDSHTNPKKGSQEDDYAVIALRVAKELYCYHQTVADVLKPLLFFDFQENFDNVTVVSGQQDVFKAWASVSEANQQLRYGYGLSSKEIGQILSWQHGEDVSESCRKKINLTINELIQQYVDRLFLHGVCEVDIPVAFSIDAEELTKVLKDCCSPTDILAASSRSLPLAKPEIEVMLQRELPRVTLCLNGSYYNKASPGKAYENSTLKMRTVREVIATSLSQLSLDATKEQIDLFCLRVLAMSSISVSSAASRTAVVMAFGKYNLVHVKPMTNASDDKLVYINVDQNEIHVDVPSKWCITEDSSLFKSLCRDSSSTQIAVVSVSYHVVVNIEDFLKKRIEPVPVAHIRQCTLRHHPSSAAVKKDDPLTTRSKSIKVRLTRATTKLFHRKSFTKDNSSNDINSNNNYIPENEGSSSESGEEYQPVPPPRLKRKAKNTKKKNAEKKEDLSWFSTSTSKFNIPPVVPALTESKDLSPSVASFEELQGVINFLSGSSSSSLALNEKDKLRKTAHKRTNSSTSLQNHDNKKIITKQKVSHKKSASFSGNTNELKAAAAETEEVSKDNNTETKEEDEEKSPSQNCGGMSSSTLSNDSEGIPKRERTPGDGMDQKLHASISTSNIVHSVATPQKNLLTAPTVLHPDATLATEEDNPPDSPVPDWFDEEVSSSSLTQEVISKDTMSQVLGRPTTPGESSGIADDIAELSLKSRSSNDDTKSPPAPPVAPGALLPREPLVAPSPAGVTNYQPFNSRMSWPMQNSGLGTLWSSDTSSEGEKPSPVVTSEGKGAEFTIDKQQDFQNLLEGSRFLSDYQPKDNWKDRPSSVFQPANKPAEMFPKMREATPDPWPLQGKHTHQQQQQQAGGYPALGGNPIYNIEQLQLPPNPTGPYMRQNREQLLAKQQILEQFARQQKKQQLQQQQQAKLAQYQAAQKKLLLQQKYQQQQQQQHGVGFNNNQQRMMDRPGILDRMMDRPGGMMPDRIIDRPDRPGIPDRSDQFLRSSQYDLLHQQQQQDPMLLRSGSLRAPLLSNTQGNNARGFYGNNAMTRSAADVRQPSHESNMTEWRSQINDHQMFAASVDDFRF